MDGCLLRVNHLPITSVRIHRTDDPQDVKLYIEDPDFGPFPLSRSCLLEFLDLSTPKSQQIRDPFHGWRRVSYDELVDLLTAFCVTT